MLDFCHQLILSALPSVFDVDTLRLIPSAMLIDWSIYISFYIIFWPSMIVTEGLKAANGGNNPTRCSKNLTDTCQLQVIVYDWLIRM